MLGGYGNDGKNSGFKVALPNDLISYYINYDEVNNDCLKVPHITASLSKDEEASNTKNLIFNEIKPIVIRSKFGYWIKEGNNEYLSYEKYFYKEQ